MSFAIMHPPVVALLLNANASPDRTPDKFHPPLIIAGLMGKPAVVQMLLDAGARHDKIIDPDNEGEAAWVRLAQLLDNEKTDGDDGDAQQHCLDLLVRKDERLLSTQRKTVLELEEILTEVSYMGSVTGVKILLDAGVNPDGAERPEKIPPLVAACLRKSAKNLECVKTLLARTPMRSAYPNALLIPDPPTSHGRRRQPCATDCGICGAEERPDTCHQSGERARHPRECPADRRGAEAWLIPRYAPPCPPSPRAAIDPSALGRFTARS